MTGARLTRRGTSLSLLRVHRSVRDARHGVRRASLIHDGHVHPT